MSLVKWLFICLITDNTAVVFIEGDIFMVTYQEKNFLCLLEKFENEYLEIARKKEDEENKWRKAFIAEYPREDILSMQIDSYLISRKRADNTFCRRICSELNNVFHINVGDNVWEEVFGIAVKNGKQLKMSKSLVNKYGDDYNSAFAYIKKEIISLLNEVDKGNYAAVECCELSYDVKYMLLIIYCPDKILPVCNINLIFRYCERTGITFDYYKEIIHCSNLLISFKNDVPEFHDWSHSIFTSFCDWLYKNNRDIDGNFLRSEARITKTSIITEIDDLNLKGEEKDAIVKMRVNQGVFRNKLLQRYDACCICGISNQSLLIASHIKPWSISEPVEKLDIDNGFLMCPNHDRLFDKGLITFDDDGKIMISNKLSDTDKEALNISDEINILITQNNRKYLQYHRQKVFENI